MSKMSRSGGPFDQQHGKRVEGLLKSAWQHLYPIHWSLRSQLSWKKSLLLTCQILGLLVNTFPTDEKYPLLKRDNLTIPIKVQLPQKQKTFYQFLTSSSKSTQNFEHFEQKHDPHRFNDYEITGLQKRSQINA